MTTDWSFAAYMRTCPSCPMTPADFTRRMAALQRAERTGETGRAARLRFLLRVAEGQPVDADGGEVHP